MQRLYIGKKCDNMSVSMENLFQTGMYDVRAIIQNESALVAEYTPIHSPLREREIREISNALKPLMHRSHGKNLFIHGPPGSGKMTSMKYLLLQITRETRKVLPVYVNCWAYPTPTGVYSKILEALEMPFPRRGMAADEMLSRICQRIDHEDVTILLVLDKVQNLITHREENLFHSVAIANNQAHARFGIVSLSAYPEALEHLSMQVKSTLHFSTLEFKEFEQNQIYEILVERAGSALVDGSWSSSILETCAFIGKANGGNARLSLEILWKAACHAQERGGHSIEQSDVETAYFETEHAKIKIENLCALFEVNGFKLSEEENLALRILVQNGEMTSSEFYSEFMDMKMVSKRQIRNYLALLEAKGIIRMEAIEHPGLLNGTKLALKMGGLNGLCQAKQCQTVSAREQVSHV